MSRSGDQSISGKGTRGSEDQNICGSGNQRNSGKDNSKSEYQNKPIAGFEKLWFWQKAHQLMLEVHKICQTLLSLLMDVIIHKGAGYQRIRISVNQEEAISVWLSSDCCVVNLIAWCSIMLIIWYPDILPPDLLIR